MSERWSRWYPVKAAPAAVSAAKADCPYRILTVAKVEYVPQDGAPGWRVTLAVAP